MTEPTPAAVLENREKLAGLAKQLSREIEVLLAANAEQKTTLENALNTTKTTLHVAAVF